MTIADPMINSASENQRFAGESMGDCKEFVLSGAGSVHSLDLSTEKHCIRKKLCSIANSNAGFEWAVEHLYVL